MKIINNISVFGDPVDKQALQQISNCMDEVFIFTAFRYISERDIYQSRYAEYLTSIWNDLSAGTRECIVRDVESMMKNPVHFPAGSFNKWGFILELKPEGENKGTTDVQINEEFIMYAVKYGVGRMSYVVSWLVEELEKIWVNLHYETKLDIQSYISVQMNSGRSLGMDCDKSQWMRVLDWELN